MPKALGLGQTGTLSEHAAAIGRASGLGIDPITISLITTIIGVFANCWKNRNESKSPQQHLRENLDDNGEFPDSFIQSRENRAATLRGIRIENRKRRPRDRVKIRDIDVDDLTRQTFKRVLAVPHQTARAAYGAALEIELPEE